MTVCRRAIQVAARSASARRALGLRARRLRGLVEAGVVDRQPGAAAQRERDAQVVRSVRRVRLGRDEADRAEHPAAGGDRHDERGVQGELRDHGADLGVRDGAVQQVPVDVLDQLGLARARHLRRPDRGIGRQRQARAQLARERDAVGIGVRRGGGDERAVLVEQVDHAPVAEPRHAEVGEPLERHVQVERLGQELPGRDQEAQALAFPPARLPLRPDRLVMRPHAGRIYPERRVCQTALRASRASPRMVGRVGRG